jgi:hypothetical protein
MTLSALERWQLRLQRGTPTSESHNSLVRTPIRANFISLEIRHQELFDDMLHDLFWIPEDHQNHPKKSGQKTTRARKSRRIRKGGCVADKIATWRMVRLSRHHHVLRGMMPREACHSAYKRNAPPPPASGAILLGL